ncbi:MULTISPECIES: type III-A CRISPR-associated protein Cas10/Csm1 [Clostridium]|uniref:type III-A CRISPR-associated protein Cas10/Csm1 n=1 Tax=Clostridium TaxID=1485 RepID=UPI00082676B0|nr:MULTISPECIES: type III-A CRISPR-associated protein Cas10/Csm1 [Clostridium]
MDKDETYYRNITAAAALLHDLGKFIRRAKEDRKSWTHWEFSYKYINKYFKGFSCIDDEMLDAIASIAALHHYDSKQYKKIKGYKDEKRKDELIEIEDFYEDTVKKDKNYKCILNKVIIGDIQSSCERKIHKYKYSEMREWNSDCKYKGNYKSKNNIAYNGTEESPIKNIFTTLNNILNDNENQKKYNKYMYFEPNSLLEMGYREIYLRDKKETIIPKIKEDLDGFKSDLEIIKGFKKLKIEDCINSWNFLLKKYTSFICSSKWETIKDISLYNHSQTTAAIAVSTPLKKDEEFYAVHGKIYDIQKYIYNGINSNIEKPMKRIYVRSFLISLINILIPNILVRELGLYTFNILFCGGGTFTIIMPNDEEHIDMARGLMNKLTKKIEDIFENKIFIEYEIGEIKVKLKSDRMYYEKCFKPISTRLYEKKYNRNIKNLVYDDSKQYEKCKNCNINYKLNEENSKECGICSIEDKWIKDGFNIEKLCIDYNKVSIEDIADPDKFMIGNIEDETPIICFSQQEAEKLKTKYPIVDVYDIGKTYVKKSYEKCKNCLGKDICDGPITEDKISNEFYSLDCFANKSENDKIVATAKIDVDDFEFLLYFVYPRQIFNEIYNFSISRLANTSMLFNLFFAMQLKKLIEEKFKDKVMILYAGGDDIMFTGNWESVVEAVEAIKKEFRKYTNAENTGSDNVTITSSIKFHNSKRPFNLIAYDIEKQLTEAKDNGKNCVNLNGKLLTYEKLEEVIKVSDILKGYVEKEYITRAILYKLNEILKMCSSEDEIDRMRSRSIYHYLIESEIEGNKNLTGEIKNKVKKQLDTLVEPRQGENEYTKEKLIIEFAIRKTRRRGEVNDKRI